jgi:hypothetical protein
MFTLLALALGGLSVKSASIFVAFGALVFGMAWITDEPFVKLFQTLGLIGTTGGVVQTRRVVAKTADYTVTAADFLDQVYFTTRGAGGAVNFTLPLVSAQLAGKSVTFKNLVDQNMTVTSNPADTLIVDGDLTADSLATSTASHKIGGEIEVFCDGTAFIASGKNVGVTYTVAT